MMQHDKLINELRLKLKSKIDLVLTLRKEIDFLKEDHQLTKIKYDKLKDAITKEIDNRLNKIRTTIDEIVE